MGESCIFDGLKSLLDDDDGDTENVSRYTSPLEIHDLIAYSPLTRYISINMRCLISDCTRVVGAVTHVLKQHRLYTGETRIGFINNDPASGVCMMSVLVRREDGMRAKFLIREFLKN